MEAARVPWRMLGELFVAKGLVTEAELEEALDEQQTTGRRLGEILVKKGYVAGPELTIVLADQMGVDMETQTGFGSGLWQEIKRRNARTQVLEASQGEPATRTSSIEAWLNQMETDPDEDPREADREGETAGIVDIGELSARRRLATVEQRLEEECAQHQTTREALDEARAESAGLAAELEEAKERAASLEARAKEADLPISEDSSPAMHESDRVSALEGELTAAREEAKITAAHAAKALDELAEARRQLAVVQAQVQLESDSSSAAEDELEQLHEELARLAEDSQQAEQALVELRTNLGQREAEALEAGALAAMVRTEADQLAQRVDALTAELEHALAQSEHEARVLQERVGEEQAASAAAEAEVDRLRAQLAELEPLPGRVSELEARLAAEAGRAELALRDDAISHAHVVLRPSQQGYVLVVREGTCPDAGAEEEIDGRRYVVAKVGRSPLPADPRRCAFLEAA